MIELSFAAYQNNDLNRIWYISDHNLRCTSVLVVMCDEKQLDCH